MSERISSPEFSQERIELNTALLTYFISASMFASSQGFEDDVAAGVYMINRGDKEWYNGTVITDAHKRSYAASSILVQLHREFNQPDTGFSTIVLSPVVRSQVDSYLSAQQTLDDLDLRFNTSFVDGSLIRPTIRAMDDSGAAPNIYSERAAEQWIKRGTLELDMIDLDELDEALANEDHSQKVPDAYYEVGGLHVSEYPLPETPVTRRTVPYYKKFYDEKQGEEWLAAIFEDLKAIKEGGR